MCSISSLEENQIGGIIFNFQREGDILHVLVVRIFYSHIRDIVVKGEIWGMCACIYVC